jgi:hypothetical protein
MPLPRDGIVVVVVVVVVVATCDQVDVQLQFDAFSFQVRHIQAKVTMHMQIRPVHFHSVYGHSRASILLQVCLL